MATIAVITNLNQQTIEQTLLDIDPSITFGTLGDADNPIVFGTATARTIRQNLGNPGVQATRLDITPLAGYRTYTVYLNGSDVLPNYSNYRWSEVLGDVPTRVIFNLKHVTEVR
jgi:hypothetical protein